MLWPLLYYIAKSTKIPCAGSLCHVRYGLTLCMQDNFSCFCGRLLSFVKINFFKKNLSGTLSKCQTVWIQIRTDVPTVLISVQTVCKGYQQTTKVAISKERDKVIPITHASSRHALLASQTC